VVRWLQPGTGQNMLYRLLDTLMETQIFATVGWRGIRHLPSRTLPPKALIVALTPLLDERGVTALFDLLARGYDLAIVDVSPLMEVGEAEARAGKRAAVLRGVPGRVAGDRWAGEFAGWWRRGRTRRAAQSAALAERLWALKREALRHRYQELGAAVVEWRVPTELEQVVYEVEACRRRIAPTFG
jgi:uncharacterized protein (DUF58 family)